MPASRAVVGLVAALVVAAGLGPAAAGAQADTTLTVAVETPSGEGVGDATLTAVWDDGNRSRTTAANGMAFLSVPEGADVEIYVDHPDFVRNHPLVVEDASDREVEMTVHPKASLVVTVEDGEGPVSGAEVSFRKNGRVAAAGSTGGDGVVDSGVVEAGTYDVVVSRAGYFVQRRTIEVSGNAAETVQIQRGTVTLRVNVTDDHFDPPQPVGGVTVNVTQSGVVRTQPAGIGLISVPVNTWLNVVASKSGYESTTESVFLGESDQTLNLTIQRTPAISAELLSDRVVPGENVLVEVADEYGTPVEGASVRLDGETVAETDAEGRAVVEVPSAGNHSVVVEHDGLQAGPLTLVGVDEAGGGTAPGTTAADGGATETETELPGFGPIVALLALLALLGAGLGRRR